MLYLQDSPSPQIKSFIFGVVYKCTSMSPKRESVSRNLSLSLWYSLFKHVASSLRLLSSPRRMSEKMSMFMNVSL